MIEKKDQKARIIEVASEQFAKYGYKNVKTNELANLLGISKRTLYDYFASKEQLYSDIVDSVLYFNKQSIDELISQINADNDMDFFDILNKLWSLHLKATKIFTREFLMDIEMHSPKVWNRMQEFREQQFKENFDLIYKVGVEKGIVKSNLNKDIIYHVHITIFGNLFKQEVIANLPLTTKEVIENITNILFTGTLTEKGAAYLNEKNKECCPSKESNDKYIEEIL